jgi:hypothetical protein
MVLSFEDEVRVYNVIADLQALGVDGEMMQFIIEQVGMRDQMLRQLVLAADLDSVEELVEEKIVLESDKKL